MVEFDNRSEKKSMDIYYPLLEDVVTAALARCGANARAEVSLSFVSADEIRALNKKWRGVDRVTDVLSFPLEEEDNLGDVVICPKRAFFQAAEYGHSNERELAFLTAHGVLHLLGHDHETADGEREMFALQDLILEGLGVGREG